ncbi:hypothetical protein SCFA_340004 [anaerobic digester metagenome]|uniref:Uncharacterized protein n=1 Tax=anaerobic digester metagenome TaxID=1263854 RepID=A0A485M3P4_9ZZZZ
MVPVAYFKCDFSATTFKENNLYCKIARLIKKARLEKAGCDYSKSSSRFKAFCRLKSYDLKDP